MIIFRIVRLAGHSFSYSLHMYSLPQPKIKTEGAFHKLV